MRYLSRSDQTKSIDLTNREQVDLGSAKVQMTAWIRFRMNVKNENVYLVRLHFSSGMAEIFQNSDSNEIVNEMFTHIKMQIEKRTLKCRFTSMKFYLSTLISIS